MIDQDVLADASIAMELARTTDYDAAALVGLGWRDDPERFVALHPSWRDEPLLARSARESLQLRRRDLEAVAAECRLETHWAPLLVATNAWGYGPSMYGAWRNQRLLQIDDLDIRLTAAVATLDADGPVAAYYRLANEGHLPGWGPWLFTRFLHFADTRDVGRAMILDTGLAAAVNALVPGTGLAGADWSTPEYAFYVTLIHRLAAEVWAEPAVVEAVLYQRYGDLRE